MQDTVIQGPCLVFKLFNNKWLTQRFKFGVDAITHCVCLALANQLTQQNGMCALLSLPTVTRKTLVPRKLFTLKIVVWRQTKKTTAKQTWLKRRPMHPWRNYFAALYVTTRYISRTCVHIAANGAVLNAFKYGQVAILQ